MENPAYLLLLNEELKKDLTSLSVKEKERIYEKLSFLENGMWDAGVRVKKLKGASNKVIFEARVNKGDRLIFTLGRDKNRTCIYLWAVIHHDNISSKARTILPDNAPFLNFETISEETLDDLYIDALSEDLFTQESIEQKVMEDYGPQKWMDIGNEQLKRLLGKNNPDFFELFLYLTDEQQEVLNLKPPILLSGTAGSGKTTLAVYYLLKGSYSKKDVLFVTCSQFLKEYSQKLYKGLIVDSPLEDKGGNVEFIMLRELILRILSAKKIELDLKKEVDLKGFTQIFSKHSLSKKYDPELVWEEIRSIIKGANPPVSLRHYQSLISRYLHNTLTTTNLRQLKDSLLALKSYGFIKKIERIIEKKSTLNNFTDFVQHLTMPNQQESETFAFILREILRIIEAKEGHLTSALLSLEEYNELGKKRAPNFLYDRGEIYNIAVYYQQQLEAENRFDEIDLCRKAIVALEQLQEGFQWDLVVSDEVQDFSDIQLTLLFKLSKKPGELVCLGDPKQIINPSGFRWEELKNRFYEQGIVVPPVHHLHLNFRCIGSIVKLSNALLKLKQQLVGISGYEQMEEWKFNGRPPYLIHGLSEGEMTSEVASTAAGQVILVRSDSEKRKLMKSLNTELVFTIHEAKGLEFDTVLLWKFSSDAKSFDIWRKIQGENYLSPEHNPLIRHEINLLYVAVTRARNTLLIYDGSSVSPVWQIETLHPHVFSSKEKDALKHIWKRVSSRKEWDNQGDYFFKRKYYKVASECYRNSSNDEMCDVCEAYINRGEKNYLISSALFFKRGRKREAAQDYEDGGVYDKALKLWKELKQKDRALVCEIFLLESEEKYEKAADLWVKHKRFDKAVENWKKAKAFSKLGSYYEKLKSYTLAGEYYVLSSEFKKAALCYKKLKEYKVAGEYYVKSGDYKEALPLYIKAKAMNEVIACYTALKDYYQLASLYEKRKEYREATREFSLYANVSNKHKKQLIEEAHIMEQSSREIIKAALRYASVGKHKEAATLFVKKKLYEIAVDEYLQAGEKKDAAIYYTILDKKEEAIELYEEIGDRDSLYQVIHLLRSNLRKGGHYNQKLMQACYDTGERLFRNNEYSKALSRYLALNEPDGVFKSGLLVTGDRDEEVLDYFMQIDKVDKGIEFIEKKKNIVISQRYIQSLMKGKNMRLLAEILHGEEDKILLEILAKLYSQKNSYDVSSIILTYLRSFTMLYQVEQAPKAFIDLIINTRYLNHIFMIVSRRITQDESFIKECKKRLLSKTSSHDTLITTLCQEELPPVLDAVLQDITIDMDNYLLCTRSLKRNVETLNFLKKNCSDYTVIVDFCYKAEMPKEAAFIYEQEGKHKHAARLYYESKDFADALRCYTILRDLPGTAKTYEAMHRFDDALAIYTTLGATSAISRMKKKMQKEGYLQKELF
ncbi:MAG: hypothetical protein EOM67_07415 [Spirochaetia bacterium]|nr:hypothetical protein [Spirochaetia bacterium]